MPVNWLYRWLLLLPLLPAVLAAQDIRLTRGGTQVTVQPQFAGRVTSLRFAGSPELVAPAPADWNPEVTPRPRLDAKWRQDTGQVIWAGPQQTWWADGDAWMEKGDTKFHWPPDPDWTLASFEILERTESKIVLRSPVSRVTGLQLIKTVECLANGKVRVHAIALNRSERTVYRDLWFNFRAHPASEEYVPVNSATDVACTRPAASRSLNGFHTLSLPALGTGGYVDNKAQINPAAGWIACSGKGGFLLLEFTPPDLRRTASGHSPVEIYRIQKRDGLALLELETHSEAAEIPPHGKIEAEQLWSWVPYSGADTPVARTKFLEEL